MCPRRAVILCAARAGSKRTGRRRLQVIGATTRSSLQNSADSILDDAATPLPTGTLTQSRRAYLDTCGDPRAHRIAVKFLMLHTGHLEPNRVHVRADRRSEGPFYALDHSVLHDCSVVAPSPSEHHNGHAATDISGAYAGAGRLARRLRLLRRDLSISPRRISVVEWYRSRARRFRHSRHRPYQPRRQALMGRKCSSSSGFSNPQSVHLRIWRK